MSRDRIERRNRKVVVMVERRHIDQKQVALMLGLKWGNVRQIISRWRREQLSQLSASQLKQSGVHS